MNIKIALLLSFVGLGLFGCAAKPTEVGAQVELIKDEPKGCKFLGDIEATADFLTADATSAKINLRNKGAEMGANVVVMDTVGPKNALSGRAFSCKK